MKRPVPESNSRTIKVAVGDTRRLLAEAVAALVGTMPGFAVSGLVPADRALSAVGEQEPDVLLLGVAPGSDAALEIAHGVRASAPAVEIVLLADALEPHLIKFVLDERLTGLLLTDLAPSDFAMCLDQVAHGRAVLPAGWQDTLAERRDDPLAALSCRQMEVLELLAAGSPYEAIASRLFISVNTVKFHVRSIFSQLGVHNRLEAARLLAESDHPHPEGTATGP
ncbi:MAG TPA: response regulator transcription factor [Solirubrobacteraceae bacterium]|nr:response regulator transcription factor [Solirubrobacteraceae bacterium]